MSKGEFVQALDTFYESYLVDTVDGAFRILKTFTYGEMVIAFLLFLILLVLSFQWVWSVLHD